LLLRLRTTIAALLRPRTFALAALVASRRQFARSRFPLPHLLLHVSARLRFLFCARLVETAVRAAFPTFRVCLPAVRTGDALRQRHREIGSSLS